MGTKYGEGVFYVISDEQRAEHVRLLICDKCGAAVALRAQHHRWHKKQKRKTA